MRRHKILVKRLAGRLSVEDEIYDDYDVAFRIDSPNGPELYFPNCERINLFDRALKVGTLKKL